MKHDKTRTPTGYIGQHGLIDDVLGSTPVKKPTKKIIRATKTDESLAFVATPKTSPMVKMIKQMNRRNIDWTKTQYLL